MKQKEIINQEQLKGILVIAGVVGLVTGSWLVTGVVASSLLAVAVSRSG